MKDREFTVKISLVVDALEKLREDLEKKLSKAYKNWAQELDEVLKRQDPLLNPSTYTGNEVKKVINEKPTNILGEVQEELDYYMFLNENTYNHGYLPFYNSFNSPSFLGYLIIKI